MDRKSVIDFKDLTLRYPYCSTIQVLFAIGLYNENDLDFNLQLKRAAACVVSRKKLKVFFSEPDSIYKPREVSLIQQQDVVDLQEAPVEQQLTPVAELPAVEIHQEDPEGKKTRLELLEIVHSRLAEIREAIVKPVEPDLGFIPEESAVTNEEPVTPDPINSHIEEVITPETDRQLLSKEEILTKFIRDEPRISSPKSTFFKPSEIAAKSNVDEEDIVSETLAQLFYEQGNLAKAVKIYEKLSLLFPEKSRYFADQILKMSTK